MITIHHFDHLPRSKNSIGGNVVLHFPDGFEMVICVSEPAKVADICLNDIVNVAVTSFSQKRSC